MSPEREHSESLRIEAYLKGAMNPEQRLAFEAECEADADLQALLEQYLLSKHVVQRSGDQDQKDQWQDLRTEMLASQSKVRPLNKAWSYIAVAGVIFLLIWGGLMWYASSPTDPEALFTAFYERPLAPERMGSTALEAERHYREGNFEKSIASYEALSRDSSPSLSASSYLYWGIAYLEVDKLDSALARFAELENLPEQRDWYTALIYLKKGEQENGMRLLKEIVADEEHFFQKQAIELLEEWGN